MTANSHTIAFIGGGNMASALIGGLLRQGYAPAHIEVVEPYDSAREQLRSTLGVTARASASSALAHAGMVVWAVKPQVFKQACAQAVPHLATDALHLSVAAGIRSASIAQWLGSERIVRAMPNTPALVGLGMTALYARPGVDAQDRARIEAVITSTGQYLWVEHEPQLDAVTAVSGSGPAYVFYFLEAMTRAGTDMGLSAQQAHQLAVGTFVGASELAQRSSETPAQLRERVTSKGGTTYAALSHLEQTQVAQHFMQALHAAQQRAQELGDEFGSNPSSNHP